MPKEYHIVWDIDETLSEEHVTEENCHRDNCRERENICALMQKLSANVVFSVCTNSADKKLVFKFLDMYFDGRVNREKYIADEHVILGDGSSRDKTVRVIRLHEAQLGKEFPKDRTLLIDDGKKICDHVKLSGCSAFHFSVFEEFETLENYISTVFLPKEWPVVVEAAASGPKLFSLPIPSENEVDDPELVLLFGGMELGMDP